LTRLTRALSSSPYSRFVMAVIVVLAVFARVDGGCTRRPRKSYATGP